VPQEASALNTGAPTNGGKKKGKTGASESQKGTAQSTHPGETKAPKISGTQKSKLKWRRKFKPGGSPKKKGIRLTPKCGKPTFRGLWNFP